MLRIAFVLAFVACGSEAPPQPTPEPGGSCASYGRPCVCADGTPSCAPYSSGDTCDCPDDPPETPTPSPLPHDARPSLVVPEGWESTDASRYGLTVTSLTRGDESYDVTTFPIPMTLERFHEMTSEGRGFIEATRQEASEAGFEYVNRRDFQRDEPYTEIAVYHGASQSVCTQTDLHSEEAVTEALEFCRGLRFQ